MMISVLTEHNADITLEALSIGAVDFIAKPVVDVEHTLNDYAEEIIEKVIMASKANFKRTT
ncbi:hypothetical protein [Methylocucumis oryzae]|uniref:hypothetical protein n=1 Tax=Methylocucumis oryzae TaxID=1632867 RepID=UPI003F6AC20A